LLLCIGMPFVTRRFGSNAMLNPLMVRFDDDEVLSPDFKQKLAEVSKVVQPFVRW
jgi:hypothetical protein